MKYDAAPGDVAGRGDCNATKGSGELPMSITHDMPAGRSNRQVYRRNRIPEDFVDIIADHRACGRTDDDIALTFGINVESLHKRFAVYGIPIGRRWRDIEDARCAPVMTKTEVRRIIASSDALMDGPAVPRHARRAS